MEVAMAGPEEDNRIQETGARQFPTLSESPIGSGEA
jgi:hypothetical protein